MALCINEIKWQEVLAASPSLYLIANAIDWRVGKPCISNALMQSNDRILANATYMIISSRGLSGTARGAIVEVHDPCGVRIGVIGRGGPMKERL